VSTNIFIDLKSDNHAPIKNKSYGKCIAFPKILQNIALIIRYLKKNRNLWNAIPNFLLDTQAFLSYRGNYDIEVWSILGKGWYSRVRRCWPWKYSKLRGYGKTGLRGLPGRAHRAAYFLTYGEIPKGKYVLHTCDNPSCCNPSHLYIGTQQDNINDMFERGRARYPRQDKKLKIIKNQVVWVDPRLASWPYAPDTSLVRFMDMATWSIPFQLPPLSVVRALAAHPQGALRFWWPWRRLGWRAALSRINSVG
jgi:hypothetical protein